MRTVTKLPALRATLLRLFPGKKGAYTRMTVRRTAEHSARHAPQWPAAVAEDIRWMHGDRLRIGQFHQICEAVSEDMLPKGPK